MNNKNPPYKIPRKLDKAGEWHLPEGDSSEEEIDSENGNTPPTSQDELERQVMEEGQICLYVLEELKEEFEEFNVRLKQNTEILQQVASQFKILLEHPLLRRTW